LARALNFGKWMNSQPAGKMPDPFKIHENKAQKFSEVSLFYLHNYTYFLFFCDLVLTIMNQDCHNVCSRILQAFAIALEVIFLLYQTNATVSLYSHEEKDQGRRWRHPLF
jgi:hypothetical protein